MTKRRSLINRVARYALDATDISEKMRTAFWAKVDVRGDDECWIWKGSLAGNGYGAIHGPKRNERAHRVSYVIAHGLIPAGMYVCHTCDNHVCVNPKHLWLGTARDNMVDMERKGRHSHPPEKLFVKQEICKRGHPMSGDNLLIRRRGKERCCRICRNAANRQSTRRTRAARRLARVAA